MAAARVSSIGMKYLIRVQDCEIESIIRAFLPGKTFILVMNANAVL